MNLRAGAAPVDDRPDRGHPLGARADGTWRSSSRWPPSARRAGASSSSCRPLRERSRFDRHDPEPSGLRSARLSESSVDPTSVGGFLVSGSPAPAAPWLPAPAASAPSRRPWLPWLPCPWLPRSWWLRLQSRGLESALLALRGCGSHGHLSAVCASTVERHGSSTAARPGVHRQQPGPPGRGPALLALWGCSYRFAGLHPHGRAPGSRGQSVTSRPPPALWPRPAPQHVRLRAPPRLRPVRASPGAPARLPVSAGAAPVASRPSGPGVPGPPLPLFSDAPFGLPLGEGVHCAFGPGAGMGASHRQPWPPPALWPRPPSSTTAT